MNSTDDQRDKNSLDDLLLPYVSPRILDEKPIPLDKNGLPLDYREIAATLNRALDYAKKSSFWFLIYLCFFILWFVMTCSDLEKYLGISGASLFQAVLLLACPIFFFPFSLYHSYRWGSEIKKLKKQTNYPFFRLLDFYGPEGRAVRLLGDAGYKAKYHKYIDMSQFDLKEEETSR